MQLETLDMIRKTDRKLARAYYLKEELRTLLKMDDEQTAREALRKFFWHATHSRIPAFRELAYKIRRHEDHILNTIRYKMSNARIEATNNKIKLIIRIAYGFHNVENLKSMILLIC